MFWRQVKRKLYCAFVLPSASGNYSEENLPLSEIHLGFVFAAPTPFPITVFWKWIFRQTENTHLQIKAVDFAQLEEII